MAQRRLTRWVTSSASADRLLALVALIPVVVLLVRQVTDLGNRSVPCCDFSSLELGTRAFLRGEQLVGLYSREGWRHPGPAPFMWSSLFRVVPGRSFAEHQVAAVVLALAALSTVIVASWNRVTLVGRSVVVAVVAIFIWRFDLDAMRSPWNPFGSGMWTMAAVVCTAVFTQTRSQLTVGFAVFAGSMAAQTHVGAAPAIGVCFTVIVWILFRSRHRRENPRNAWTAASIFLLLWFLPLADLAFGNRNLVRILTTSSTSEAVTNRSEVWTGAMWIFGNSPGRIGETFGPSSPFVDVRNVIILDIVAITVVLGLAVLGVVRWRKDRFAATLSGLGLVSGAVTIAALLISGGEFLRYLLLPVSGIGAILWIAAGLTLTRLLQRHEHNLLRLLAWPVVLVLSVLSIAGMQSKPFTNDFVDGDIQSVVEQVRAECSRLPASSIVQVDDDIEWFDALPVIVALEECGKVRVIGYIGFLAGQPYRANDGAVVNVILTSGETDGPATSIASSSALTVSVVGE